MIVIGEREIGRQMPPFIIAEMSGNHNQSLKRALKIIEAASRAGVHAIKFQTYTPDTMTLDVRKREFMISDPNSLWYGKSLYELYEEAHTPWDWLKPMFERARDLGMIAFSTAFDDTAVDFLEELEVPCYKIASFENTDLSLVSKVAATGKPMIISTGMATVAELDETVQAAREAGCGDIILLKCSSTYPTSPEDTNLLTIPHMRELFGCEVGLSDHTMGLAVAVTAIALGATVIEKHFTLSRDDGGVDSAFSMQPEEMLALAQETKRAWQAIGRVHYGPTVNEQKSLKYRRSLYITKDMRAGDTLSRENVRAVRPGYGLSTKYLDKILGLSLKCDVSSGTPLHWDFLK